MKTADTRAINGAADALRESAKQHRTNGNSGHAAMCEAHAKKLDEVTAYRPALTTPKTPAQAQKKAAAIVKYFKDETAQSYADEVSTAATQFRKLDITDIIHDKENREILFYWNNGKNYIVSVRYSWNEPKLFIDAPGADSHRVYTGGNVIALYLSAAVTAAEAAERLYTFFEL